MKYFFGLLVLCAGVFASITYLKTASDDGAIATGDMSGGSGSEGGRSTGDGNVAPVVPPETEDMTPDKIHWDLNQDASRRSVAPIVIDNARMLPLDRQEVPSEREGTLLVIGTEIGPDEKVPADRRFFANIGYLLVTVRDGEHVKPDQVILGQGGSRWRRWQDGDSVEPQHVFLQKERKEYKRLEVGDEVKAGQTVALVDPTVALGDLAIKIAALDSSESERRASVQTKLEAERRVSAMEESMRRVPGSVSRDDYEGARLTAKRYFEEEIAKKSAVVKTQQELLQANTIVTRHEIHATISGTIKVIYKNRGDAVKPFEPVLQNPEPRSSARRRHRRRARHLPNHAEADGSRHRAEPTDSAEAGARGPLRRDHRRRRQPRNEPDHLVGKRGPNAPRLERDHRPAAVANLASHRRPRGDLHRPEGQA